MKWQRMTEKSQSIKLTWHRKNKKKGIIKICPNIIIWTDQFNNGKHVMRHCSTLSHQWRHPVMQQAPVTLSQMLCCSRKCNAERVKIRRKTPNDCKSVWMGEERQVQTSALTIMRGTVFLRWVRTAGMLFLFLQSDCLISFAEFTGASAQIAPLHVWDRTSGGTSKQRETETRPGRERVTKLCLSKNEFKQRCQWTEPKWCK